MKKHIIFSAVIISLSICIITVNASKLNNRDISVKNTEIHFEKSYIVKDYNGRIAVFEKNNSSPIVVYDIFTSSLPEDDLEALQKGIIADTKAELFDIISDYTS